MPTDLDEINIDANLRVLYSILKERDYFYPYSLKINDDDTFEFEVNPMYITEFYDIVGNSHEAKLLDKWELEVRVDSKENAEVQDRYRKRYNLKTIMQIPTQQINLLCDVIKRYKTGLSSPISRPVVVPQPSDSLDDIGFSLFD